MGGVQHSTPQYGVYIIIIYMYSVQVSLQMDGTSPEDSKQLV